MNIKTVPTPGLKPQLSERLRFQLLLGAWMAVGLPALLAYAIFSDHVFERAQSRASLIASAIAFAIALIIKRQLMDYPGVRRIANDIPGVIAAYGLVVLVLLGLRLEYSRVVLFSSFFLTLTFFMLLLSRSRANPPARFWVVPFGDIDKLRSIDTVSWVDLPEPVVPNPPYGGLVADLRADIPDEWERMLARAVLADCPVYHVKQIEEALTGRVDIAHLSENTLGSLVPSRAYHTLKRLIDVATAALLLPLLAIPFAAVIVAIRLDSPGPAFFRQERVGQRGEVFKIVKFRTMVHVEDADGDRRRRAMTASDDQRITRAGKWLRRFRIDELPQLINVLRGEMSLIGPRPEATALAEWYESELPFYSYRHIVRPGITGWAQVEQGHVAELADAHFKLHYDFYYIKNFSAWLDALIAMRTVVTILSGFGSK